MDAPIFSEACGRQDVTLHPKLPVLLVTVRPEAFDDLGRAIRIERRRGCPSSQSACPRETPSPISCLVSCPPRGAAPCPPLATGPGAPPTSGLDHGCPLCSSRLWTPHQGGRARRSRVCVRGHRRFPVWDEDPGRGFQAQDHHHPHQTKGHGQ